MKALLLADFYVIAKYTRAFLFMLVIFLVVSAVGEYNTFFVMYPVLLAAILSTSVLSYNERFHWDSYCDLMPVSRATRVSEKYVLTIILTGSVFLMTALVQLWRMNRGDLSLADFFSMLDTLLVLMFIAPSLMLPVVFKLGMEKGRLFYYILFGFFFAASFFLTDKVGRVAILGSGAKATLILLLLGVALFAASWRLSIFFYKKREL